MSQHERKELEGRIVRGIRMNEDAERWRKQREADCADTAKLVEPVAACCCRGLVLFLLFILVTHILLALIYVLLMLVFATRNEIISLVRAITTFLGV